MSKLRIDELHIRVRGASPTQAYSLAHQLGPHLLRALAAAHGDGARAIPQLAVRAPSATAGAIAASVARAARSRPR
jgi:hypothetical protein